MPKKSEPQDKLDIIIMHLERMDKRDRIRMVGSTLKGLISLIPVLAFIWGAWYFYENGDAIMTDIARKAAEQAAAVTKQGTQGILEQIQGSFQSE